MGAIVVTDWTLVPWQPRYYLVPTLCAWCHLSPCMCPRTGRCQCGGWIAAIDNVQAVMRAHVLSDPHASWSRRTFPERHP